MSKQQNIWIEGKVINKNNIPVSGVYIYSKFSKSSNTTSDSNGKFKILLGKGQHTLVFTHTTYKPIQKDVLISIDDPQPLYITVSLEEQEILIEEVIINSFPVSTAKSLEGITANHQEIAGGTSVAVMNPNVQRLETLKDALKFEPGVVIQESFGANDQPRISIRGSGIQSNPQRRGLQFLQDGIPVNFSDGSFITGFMDPSIAESVEVFRGANALEYGTATLGGALNFNSRTGRYSPGIKVKTETGSYGYSSLTVLAGEKWNDIDVYLSISGSGQDGFREHNENRKLGISANIGQRMTNTIDNRTYFNYSYIDFDIPGPLPLATLLKDPATINEGVHLPYTMGPNIVRDKPKREAEVMRVANRTAFRMSTSTNASLSVYYQHIQDRFVFPIVLSTQRSLGNDFGMAFRVSHSMNKHIISGGLIGSYGVVDRRGHINKNGLDSYMFSRNKFYAPNLTLYTEGRFHLGRSLNATANLQVAYNERNSKDLFPNPELRPWYSHSSHQYRYFYSEDTSLNQGYLAFNPRIGAIYNLGKKQDIQLFANVSSSYEPPTFDELIGTAVTENINTSPKQLYAVRLDKQSAVTAEIGSRYQGTRFGWNVSLYHSWLEDELLEVKDYVLGVKETKNYPNTIHRGIEAGVMVIPIKGIFNIVKKDMIVLKGMYTYSDFYFSSGDYKGNSIAGIPVHYLNASIEYKYSDKFFVSFGMESQPSESYVDHQNTLKQPSFTIYGFRIGIENWKNFSFYIEGKNIFNTYYAASYVVSDEIHLPAIPFPQFGVDNIAFFMPGQTRAFYIGLSYKL